MPNLERTNDAYDKATWTLRRARMFLAFELLGTMVGGGFGILLGLILILIGISNWIFVPSLVAGGGVGLYVGFARWHLRYGTRV